jgi:hypothetical protein
VGQKGAARPLKAKVHASRTKGSAINRKYIIKALDNFLKQLKKKRPVMVEEEW